MQKQLELKLIITEWQEEVDTETIGLIKGGVPPEEAAELAVRLVRSRRKALMANESGV